MILAFTLSLLFAADPVVIAAGTGVTLGARENVSTMYVRDTERTVSAGRELAVAWYHTESTKTDPQGKTCVYAKHGGAAVVEIECGTITNAPVVAVGGGGALVVYGLGTQLVGAKVTAGKLKKKAFKIPSKMTIGLAVGWDGTRFWLAYGDGKDAFVQRVSAAGALVGKPDKLVGESPRSGNLYVLCAATCQLLTPGASRPLARNKLGAKTGAATDQLWKLTMPTFASHPFFGPEKYRATPQAKNIVGAETPAGALVAWTRTDRPTNRGFELAFVPADPAHARHTPIAFTDEIDPVVVALDQTRFAVVSSTTGGGNHLVVRTITIDPAYFANAPAKRPAMASGHVIGADGKPAANAKLKYRVTLANGTTHEISGLVAGADGAYTIPHPAPDDHDPGQDVVDLEIWATVDSSVSDVRKVKGTAAVDIVLRASARVTLDVGTGAIASVKLEHLDELSTLRSRGVSWQKTVDVKGKLELADVPPGRLEITATTNDGRGAFVATTVAPGKSNPIRLQLGKLGSLVVGFDGKQVYSPIVILQGDESIRDLNNNHKKIIELENITPGVHEIVFIEMPWQMTRRHTVRPRATDQAKLKFEADLPPGTVGVQLTDALTIKAVAPGSPAESAGMYTGARIDQVDGTAPADSVQAAQLLRGKPGTTVTVTLGNGRTLTITRSTGTGLYAAGGPPELITGSK